MFLFNFIFHFDPSTASTPQRKAPEYSCSSLKPIHRRKEPKQRMEIEKGKETLRFGWGSRSPLKRRTLFLSSYVPS